MRSWFALIAAVLLVLSSPGLVVAQEASPATSPADLPLLADWAAAGLTGDVDRVLALFTEDGLWEEVAIGLAAQGPDEIGRTWTGSSRPCPDRTFT